MSKTHGYSRWLVGMVAGASLFAGCAGPEGDATKDAVTAEGQELRSEGEVSVSLTSAKSSFSAGERVEVSVTLTNSSPAAVRLLKWYTPAEDVEEPIFKVSREGVEADFTGPHYKRPAATDNDFIVLKPGETMTRTVDLGAFYDLSKTGSYAISFEVPTEKLRHDKTRHDKTRHDKTRHDKTRHDKTRHDKQEGLIKSNELNLWIEGRAGQQDEAPITTNGAIAYNKCDATQQNTLVQAVGAASNMANDSVSYLTTTAPSGTARYTTWFGAFNTTGWNTATTHFNAIKSAFDTKTVTIDCGCNKTYYAYVYPTKPYFIYVCKAFWAAPMTGTDSKGGTLIHEMSHFNVVVGTDDYAYGQTNAKSLARTDPAKALMNADNHEYFAENTPFQN
jgi:peptidyl-Lys metalloendopeptidase